MHATASADSAVLSLVHCHVRVACDTAMYTAASRHFEPAQVEVQLGVLASSSPRKLGLSVLVHEAVSTQRIFS